MEKEKISALLITYNEEKNIEKFIQSVLFADEIIIIDSYSSDKTKSIVEQYPQIKFIERKFDHFTNQKNYAIQQAKNEWIIFFDTDEWISKDLTDEIVKEINTSKDIVAFLVKRQWYFMGKQINYSGFQNDYIPRVFRKSYCIYNENHLVHEQLVIKGNYKRLKNIVKHYSYDSFDEFNAKLTHYVKLQADELYVKRKKPYIYHFFIKPIYRFIHHYFLRLGFLDGLEGYILASIYAFSVAKRYMFLWMKYRQVD